MVIVEDDEQNPTKLDNLVEVVEDAQEVEITNDNVLILEDVIEKEIQMVMNELEQVDLSFLDFKKEKDDESDDFDDSDDSDNSDGSDDNDTQNEPVNLSKIYNAVTDEEKSKILNTISTLIRRQRYNKRNNIDLAQYEKNDNRYQCPLCPLHFAKKENLRGHRFKEHPESVSEDEIFSCFYCTKIVWSEQGLTAHTKKMHPTIISSKNNTFAKNVAKLFSKKAV